MLGAGQIHTGQASESIPTLSVGFSTPHKHRQSGCPRLCRCCFHPDRAPQRKDECPRSTLLSMQSVGKPVNGKPLPSPPEGVKNDGAHHQTGSSCSTQGPADSLSQGSSDRDLTITDSNRVALLACLIPWSWKGARLPAQRPVAPMLSPRSTCCLPLAGQHRETTLHACPRAPLEYRWNT